MLFRSLFDHLQTVGQSLHHVGFAVTDGVDEKRAFLQQQGGRWVAGPAGAGYAFVELRDRLGATIEIDGGYVVARAKNGLRGGEVVFPKVTVGGTHTALMAASLARGTTVLRNAAREAHRASDAAQAQLRGLVANMPGVVFQLGGDCHGGYAFSYVSEGSSQLLELTPEAQQMLINYPWPGNVRQLKNVTEQICVLESGTLVNEHMIAKYIPHIEPPLPMLLGKIDGTEGMSERDIFYKVLIDMKRDVNDLKKVVFGLLEGNLDARQPMNTPMQTNPVASSNTPAIVNPAFSEANTTPNPIIIHTEEDDEDEFQEAESYPSVQTLSLEAQEIEMIKRALVKNHGKRKKAADELGISERTLYRKIKQYELED